MKRLVKHILEEKNPLVLARRNSMRKRLTNKAPSLLCPNCLGGILFHDLGLQFRSPTVNLMMTQRDFVKFLLHMEEYLAGEFVFFRHPEYTCPCAYLSGEGLEQIAVHFTHYATAEEAENKWRERARRIDRENLFVCLQERDGLTKDEILSLSGLRCRGLVVFTANRYDDIPYTVQIPAYEAGGEVGNILKKSLLNGARDYEKHFDFVKWFNEADGKSHQAKKYQKD